MANLPPPPSSVPMRFVGSEILEFEREVLDSLPLPLVDRNALLTSVDNSIARGGSFDDEPMGTKVLSIPMKYTPSHIMRFGEDVETFILALQEMWTANRGPGIRDKVEKILRIYRAANGLKVIHRFLDKNHPPLVVDVSADGSNLNRKDVNPTRSRALKMEWKLHRHWIRWLHYPGLFYEPAFAPSSISKLADIRIRELYVLYGCGRYLQEQEILDTYRGRSENFLLDPNDPNKDDLQWIFPCRQRLHSILVQVAAMGYAEPPVTQAQSQLAAMRARQGGLAGSIAQLNLSPPSREDIMKANLSRNPKLLDEMIAFVHSSMSEPGQRFDPFLRLVIDLLDKEDTFESRLAVEHVEDKLINKQVSIFDEENIATSIRGNASDYFAWLLNPDEKPTANTRLENKLYKLIEETSLVNRSRRNFRLLRDWRHKRPWRQILQIYDDTLPENQWLTQANEDYITHIDLPTRKAPVQVQIPQYGSEEDGISSLRTISQHLFGFIPILTLEIDDLPLDHSLRFPCKLCSKPFVANSGFNSSAVGLNCTGSHHFHLSCIFTFWDQPGKYLHTCPTCGEAEQLNFDRVGIDYKKTLNFAHNLMGWEVKHETLANIYENSAVGRKARAEYDVPPMPPHRDRSIIHPNEVPDGALIWWMQQNMSSLCALENPISWKAMEFEPLARSPAPGTRGYMGSSQNETVVRLIVSRETWAGDG